MAGVHPEIRLGSGLVDGRLNTQLESSLAADELLTHVPGAQDFFDELSKRGWRHYFIDGYGTIEVELAVSSLPYTFQHEEHPRGGFSYRLSVDFGRLTPRLHLKSIINLERFVLNICSKHFPRAVTVDLAKNEVTYMHDALWVSKGEEAKGILEILQWLIEEKKFILGVSGGKERYQELVAFFGRK